MKIAVLGSGNGGCALAFDFAASGYAVYMFDFKDFSDNIKVIDQNKGIKSTGQLEGFQKIVYAGHDIKRVLQGADMIFLVGPAYSTAPFAEVCKGNLEQGQKVVVCPSSCAGALVFKNVLGNEIEEKEITISETSTLPYAVRLIKPGEIKVFLKLKGGLYLATIPGDKNKIIFDMMHDVYEGLELADNLMQTTLQNANPVIHPTVTLLNSALIERTNGNFLFYEEGVTKGVGRVLKAVDDERLEIAKALNVKLFNDPDTGVKQGYMNEPTYDTGYIEAPGFKGIKAQDSLDNRYFNEDVGYGLVFLTDIAEKLEVKTPTMSSIIVLASIIMNKDYRSEGKRNLESLNMKIEDIKRIVKE